MQLGRKTIISATLAVTAVAGIAGVAQARVEAPSDNLAGQSTSSVAPERTEAALGANRFAVVDFSGNLIRGKNALDVNPLAGLPGRYEVIFDRDISNCAYTASIADQGSGDEISGVIDLARRSGNPNAVFVETSTLDDIPDLRDFHLIVTC
jgi:hypothetical protein